MTSKPICILITGMSHSGSRLPVQMLDRHPDVATAMPALKHQAEFAPLLQLFYDSIDATPLSAEQYVLDRDEFTFVMDSYIAAMDSTKPYCVIKIPYYPLNFLDLFWDYFEENIRFLFTRRPAEKVIRSFTSRGEDKLFFVNNIPETIRQIKYLGLEERQHFLTHVDAEAIFRAQIQRCDFLREQWDRAHPESPFIVLDVEQIPRSREYVKSIVEQIGLSSEHVDAMLTVVETDRLLKRVPKSSVASPFKQRLRSLTPPFLWQWLGGAKRRLF